MSKLFSPDSVYTAADIPLEYEYPVTVGKCVVTTVYLNSERPRGRIRHRPVKVTEPETGDGAEVDAAELQQLAALGLPTAFASSQVPSSRAVPNKPQPRQRPATGATSSSGNGVCNVSSDSCLPRQWLQAFDPATGRTYYFQAGARAAQWEPPPAGETSLPVPFAWSSQLRALQTAADHLAVGLDSCGIKTQHISAIELRQRNAPVEAASAASNQPPLSSDSGPTLPAESSSACAGAGAATPAGPNGAAGSTGGDSGREDDGWVRGPLPRKLWKYWMQRYTLFARFDQGVLLDEEGWFSVTPEAIARHHAERCACNVILDPFAGVGGNAIQFAATCSRVIAGELSPDRASLIRHNAGVYGVADQVEVRCCDFWDATTQFEADIVFLSPPWGGLQYLAQPLFSVAPEIGNLGASLAEVVAASRKALVRNTRHGGDHDSGIIAGDSVRSSGSDAGSPGSALQPVFGQVGYSKQGRSTADGVGCSEAGAGETSTYVRRQKRRGIVAFLPKNTSLAQLSDLAPEGETIEVERNILDGFFKGVTVFFWENL